MRDVKHASISSVLFDLRTTQQRSDAKHNNQTSTLNHQELDVYTHRPAFVQQQPRIGYFQPQVLMLRLQKIILRTNSLNEKSMTLSLLGASLPFPVLKTFELENCRLEPATYSKATTQQDEQSFVIANNKYLIRITEQCDGWSVHTKK